MTNGLFEPTLTLTSPIPPFFTASAFFPQKYSTKHPPHAKPGQAVVSSPKPRLVRHASERLATGLRPFGWPEPDSPPCAKANPFGYAF